MVFDKYFYNMIGDTLNKLGWRQEMGSLQADLNDIKEACKSYLENIEKLISIDQNDEEKVCELLVAVQLNMEHMQFHTKSGLRLFKKLFKVVG